MATPKGVFVRSKPHCNIGTIGHVDHGKTTLTAAITKVLAERGTARFMAYDQIDKQVEERRRGITITASHVEYETEARHYTHIDCPGHQNYIKNMITGATQMDGAILVVALPDGIKEQTREHVILAKEVGIKYLVVYGNKLDSLIDKDMKEYVELEVRELLTNYSFPEDFPFVPGSARKALEEEEPSEIGTESVSKLLGLVDSYIRMPENRQLTAPFLVCIEDVHSIQGRGTVVTGKVERGTLTVGSEVELIGPKTFKTTCTGLQMYHKTLDHAEVGDNVGALVRNIAKSDIHRGYVLAQPGTIKAYSKFTAKAYLLTREEGGREKPIKSQFQPQFFFRTSNVTGSMILSEDTPVAMPGETIEFQVKLVEKTPLNVGLRFVMREGVKTLGSGVILSIMDN